MTINKKIGLFFGSFNPIHTAHLIVAETMRQYVPFDTIWFIVTPKSPLKKHQMLLHETARYDLTRAAIEGNTNLKVCAIEFDLPQPNYTIETLIALKKKYPTHHFSILLGEDNLVHFEQWKDHLSLLNECRLYVYPRSGSMSSQWKNHPRITRVQVPYLAISATYIRDRIKKNLSIQYLVPDRVEQMIKKNGYYIN